MVPVVEVRKRAVRRIGELMRDGPKAKGGGDKRSDHRGSKNPTDPASLADQGVDKNLAKLARVVPGCRSRSGRGLTYHVAACPGLMS